MCQVDHADRQNNIYVRTNTFCISRTVVLLLQPAFSYLRLGGKYQYSAVCEYTDAFLPHLCLPCRPLGAARDLSLFLFLLINGGVLRSPGTANTVKKCSPPPTLLLMCAQKSMLSQSQRCLPRLLFPLKQPSPPPDLSLLYLFRFLCQLTSLLRPCCVLGVPLPPLPPLPPCSP